jgi:hypothetical protein
MLYLAFGGCVQLAIVFRQIAFCSTLIFDECAGANPSIAETPF